MALTTVDAYGAPSYGPIGRPPAGMVFHTPENVDHTLTQAIAVARWQATSSNTSGGSYHGILGYDSRRGGMDNPEAWVMVRSVPWNMACGGLTANHTPPSQGGVWAPERFPWIQASIPGAAYADPNRWFHQISLSGKASWYTTNGYPIGAVIRLAEWVRTLEQAYGYDAVMTLHRMWQTNRSDPGPIDLADRVMVEYERLYLAPPPPVPAPEPPPPPPPPPPVTDPRIAEKDAAMREAIAVLTRGLER